MESGNNIDANPKQKELNAEARAYFLSQGRKISRIHSILSSNILIHYLKRWLSLLLELLCYSLFACILIVVLQIPKNPGVQVVYMNAIKIEITSPDIENIVVFLKTLAVIISLALPGLAILLKRNRRKNKLIRQAFSEVEEMKEDFDKALNELRL